MDILFRLGQASAQEVMDELPDPPSYSAIRALLATLEQKNWIVMHSKDSRRYIYRPAIPEKKAKRSALSNLLHTFFDGSPEKLVASLLDPADQKLSAEEITASANSSPNRMMTRSHESPFSLRLCVFVRLGRVGLVAGTSIRQRQ